LKSRVATLKRDRAGAQGFPITGTFHQLCYLTLRITYTSTVYDYADAKYRESLVPTPSSPPDCTADDLCKLWHSHSSTLEANTLETSCLFTRSQKEVHENTASFVSSHSESTVATNSSHIHPIERERKVLSSEAGKTNPFF